MNISNVYHALNLEKVENTDLFKKIHKKLKEKRWYKPILDYSEQAVKVNRVYLVSGASLIIALSLLFQYGISLICASVGVLYPGYKTLLVLEQPNPLVAKRWLVYWFLHAALNFFEIFLFFLNWIPLFWLIKCSFLVWCYAPLERNGSDILYMYVIQPIFQKNQAAINNVITQAVRTAHTICTDSDVVRENGDTHQD